MRQHEHGLGEIHLHQEAAAGRIDFAGAGGGADEPAILLRALGEVIAGDRLELLAEAAEMRVRVRPEAQMPAGDGERVVEIGAVAGAAAERAEFTGQRRQRDRRAVVAGEFVDLVANAARLAGGTRQAHL